MKDLYIMEDILRYYRSPWNEVSLAKNIPTKYLGLVKAAYPGKFRYRYRGQSIQGIYRRDPSYCLQSMADSFAIYKRKI